MLKLRKKQLSSKKSILRFVAFFSCTVILSIGISGNALADGAWDDDDRPLSERLEELEAKAKSLPDNSFEKSRLYQMIQNMDPETEAQMEEYETWQQFGLDGDPTKNIPDDADEGDYAEFKNKDGSTTLVYDNGTVVTKYADGSGEAVDYKGNRYTSDATGKQSIYTIDGNTINYLSDDKYEIVKPGGNTTVTVDKKNELITQNTHGLCKEHNTEGDITYYFEGSDQRIVQKFGEDLVGELHGKNGESLVVNENGASLRTADGVEMDSKYVYDGNNDYTETDVRLPNGFTCSSGEGTYFEKVDGTMKKVDRIWQSEKDPDGRTFEMDFSETPTAGGAIVKAAAEWKAPDGSRLWIDYGSQASEYYDAEDGTTINLDKNGNPTKVYIPDTIDHKGTYNDKGDLLESTTIYEDGVKLIQYSDGSCSLETPEGTFFSDGKGNVFKDGVLVKRDGIPVENPEVYGYTVEKRDEEFAPKVEDILGTWSVSLSFSNIHSEWVEGIVNTITELLPDEAADAVQAGVTYYVDENSVVTTPGTMVIEQGTNPEDVILTLYTASVEDGVTITSVYKGTMEKGHMELKLDKYTDPHQDEGAMTAGIEKLEFEFYGNGDRRYIQGTYHLDTHVLTADIDYTGERTSLPENATEQ